MTAILFVGAVVAIVFAVTMPYVVDATAIAALEFVAIALGERTRQLVAAVGTVFVMVADKVLGNAFAVRFA